MDSEKMIKDAVEAGKEIPYSKICEIGKEVEHEIGGIDKDTLEKE
jgi:hypothetical protein